MTRKRFVKLMMHLPEEDRESAETMAALVWVFNLPYQAAWNTIALAYGTNMEVE